MSDAEISYFEKRLLAEIEQIRKQIIALESESDALRRQLAKVRAEKTGLAGATRKNSLNRILCEQAVLDALMNSNRSRSSSELYDAATKTNFGLKESTFRTYLHRMKKRGLIRTAERVGFWRLVGSDDQTP